MNESSGARQGGRGTGWRLAHLADTPELVPVLADWFRQAWGPYYGSGGPGDAEADLRACRSRDALPICLVAFDAEGAPVGTAALKSTSVGADTYPGPWLAALLVADGHRGKGVATRLVAEIEREARRLGHAAVYSSLAPGSTLLRRLGWRELGRVSSLRGPAAVFRRAFGSS